MNNLQKSALVAIFLLRLAVTDTLAQNLETETQVDPGVSLALDLSERVRLGVFVGREKNEELKSGKGKFSAGVYFRTKPVFKHFLDALDTDKNHALVLGVGYEYDRATQNGVTVNENNIILEATFRWAFKGKFLFSNRNRFQPRWVGSDAHFWFREQLRLERPIRLRMKKFKRKISPVIRAEAFYDQRYKKWNIFRYGGGLEVPVFRRTSLDFYYERMRCVTCVDQNTNVITITLNFYLRRKKK
jgi:hypothetical protein